MPSLKAALNRRVDTGPAPAAPPSHRRRKQPRGLLVAEVVLSVAIAACVLIVHDVPYLLGAPFWLDEAWVADSTRESLSHLTTVTYSTPVGWTFLLRLVPGGGQQDLRLLPLFFAGLAVVAAYWFGRSLRLLPVVTGVLAAGAALLVPAMLVRDDLKEYTADAFVTVLVLALSSRLEESWSRRRLIQLCVVLVVMAFISSVTLLVAAVALPALALAQLARRRRREFIDAVAATLGTGVVLGLIYLIFDGATRSTQLKNFWAAYYLPHSPSAALRYINDGVHRLLPYVGIGHASLLAALFVLGVVVIAWQGRWATAALVPLLMLELVTLSALKKYPLLDLRTSTFLITAVVVVTAIGVAGVATLLARRVHVGVGIAVAVAAAALYIPGTINYVRDQPIPYENVRAQANFVAAHARPGDVVLVSLGAGYGYAYYARPAPGAVNGGGIGWSVTYPPSDRTIVLNEREPVNVQSGVARAVALLSGHPGARLWVVLNHVAPTEQTAWTAALARYSPTKVFVARQTAVLYVVLGSGST